MPLVSLCSCLCLIHWSQVLSGEWRCSWSSTDSDALTTSLIAYLAAAYIRDLTAITFRQTAFYIEAWYSKDHFNNISTKTLLFFVPVSRSAFFIQNLLPLRMLLSWRRHQIETFSALLALCAGKGPLNSPSPHKGQWRGALLLFFYPRLDKQLSKQSRGWWFETTSRSLRCHRNVHHLATNHHLSYSHQSGRSPKVVALFSATNFSSYIIELLQVHDTIQIKWNYARIHYNIAIRSHLMI